MVKTISSADIATGFIPAIDEEEPGVILLQFHSSSIKALLMCPVLVLCSVGCLGDGHQEKRERE